MTGRALDRLEGRRVFLTGATGFIGKWLLRSIREENDRRGAGIRACVLSRSPGAFIKEFPEYSGRDDFEFMTGDVRTFQWGGGRLDYVIHAAAPVGTSTSDAELQSIMIDGTRQTLECAAKSDAGRLLYISSGAVYGNEVKGPVGEDFPCDPQNVYGKAKLEAERLCMASGLPCVIARCFAFVGEHLPLDAHFAVGNFIRDCLENRPILIKGDGSSRRSYMYAGDLARWLWTMLLGGKTGEAYNAGSDFAVSIKELAGIVRDAAGAENEIRMSARPSGSSPHTYVPDITKARRELGLSVETGLQDGIRKTIEFHKSARQSNIRKTSKDEA